MKRTFEYINDEPTKCKDCVDLVKGMKGVLMEKKYQTDEGDLLPHYMFDNGFMFSERFVLLNGGLFQEVK